MPELPEVETMVRGIAASAGGRIGGCRVLRGTLRPIEIAPSASVLRRRIAGRRLEAVSRLGKRVVLELEGGHRVVIEPRMTGLVLPGDPPDEHYLRLVLDVEHAAGPQQILFWDQRGLGVVRLLSAEEFQRALGPSQIGPDALTVELGTLRERFGACRRPIKVALLDQQRLAGIGNIYASEILHQAGISPRRMCSSLKPAQWERVHAAMRDVLQEAVRCEGSTLHDGTYRVARLLTGGYQLQHRVYQRAGEPCQQCPRGTIARIVQAQRSTFYCPSCQR